MKQKRILFSLLLIVICLLLSRCQIIQVMQATPLPLRTDTPMLTLNQVPEMPTLPPLQPTPTPSDESQVSYEADVSLFTRVTRESVPTNILQKTTLFGTVQSVDDTAGSFVLNHASGVEFKITCDDYCFYVDNHKQLLPASSLSVGSSVIIFGVSGAEDITAISADAVAIDIDRKTTKSAVTDMSTLPYDLIYTEYELAEVPQLEPFSITASDTSARAPFDKTEEPLDLNQKLEARLHTDLSARTNYTYGWYGENYFAYAEYNKDNNRDPNYPTRANMQVESNDYPFFDFWYPFVENPMPSNWGIICYGGDWYLPIRMTVDVDPDPTVADLIYSDRTIRSQENYDRQKDYLRSFGYSILTKKLFYFYEKTSGFGFSIDLQDYDLGFDEIPFGYVDVYAELDPFYADQLITFFGRRDGKWYYVELRQDEAYAY